MSQDGHNGAAPFYAQVSLDVVMVDIQSTGVKLMSQLGKAYELRLGSNTTCHS